MTTLVDIKNAVFSHFVTQSSFRLPEDLTSVRIDPKTVTPAFIEEKEAIVRAVLVDYVKSGLIVQVSESLYVLVQPVMQLSQQVVISPLTSLMLSNLVNDWVTNSGEKKSTGYSVNQLALTDRDVAALCHICHALLEQVEDLLPMDPDRPQIPPPAPGNN